nr:PREDICTED: neuropeptide-like protein C4orf48 homolog [Equus przewalskii]
MEEEGCPQSPAPGLQRDPVRESPSLGARPGEGERLAQSRSFHDDDVRWGTLLSFALLGAQVRPEPAAGSAVPAQSRPCVDCHAFEFMQRALQDLRKTAYSLDARTETLLLQAERRALCACWPAGR